MLFLFPPYLLRLVIRGNGLTGEILFPIIQKLFSQHLVLLSLIKETQFKYNFLVFFLLLAETNFPEGYGKNR